jgi:hypothetical protein
VVDGHGVNHEDYRTIGYIPASEVSSFEIVENASNKLQLWHEFCPECSPETVPEVIDIISIYTYGGNGIYGVQKSKGIMKAVVPVFSTPRELYTPKYENLTENDWYKPDLRALIDWEPKLVSDNTGLVSTSFYNADIIGNIQVVVEAISEDGEIGYKDMTYSVRKKDR